MSNANKDKKKGAKKINDEGGVSESPQPPTDPDERMIFDAYSLAIAGVDQIVSFTFSFLQLIFSIIWKVLDSIL